LPSGESKQEQNDAPNTEELPQFGAGLVGLPENSEVRAHSQPAGQETGFPGRRIRLQAQGGKTESQDRPSGQAESGETVQAAPVGGNKKNEPRDEQEQAAQQRQAFPVP
jgi:hypothetical protein